ncbi:MAG: CPBP family glutamic-type intramembrane protease [Pseudomonadota bacterium]
MPLIFQLSFAHPIARILKLAEPSDRASLAPSQRRLQRPPDFTGSRLNRFSQVFSRHGLPVAVFGALCLLVPDLRALLEQGLGSFLAAPTHYLTVGLAVFAALLAYSFYLDRRLNPHTVAWMLYLLALSAWEEWVFRLVIPYYGELKGYDLRALVIGSNLLFGALHFFTLRWKWPWCLGAFLGGMALSRQMNLHFDLALVIGIHWIATYINTPRLPGAGRKEDKV